MSRSTFSVLFYVNRGKEEELNRHGSMWLAPSTVMSTLGTVAACNRSR